jgi:hypothetical protein
MKNFSILILVAVLFFTSCKKKENKPEPTNNNAPSTTGSTTGYFPVLSPSTGGDMCGLQTTYTYLDYNGTVTKDSIVVASFYAAPVTSVAPTNVFAGTVTLNGVNVPFQSSSSMYYIASSLPISIAGPSTWSVSGSGTITAFSQAYTPSYPKYTGGNLLPDTCIKGNGITINISGVTNNQYSVYVALYSGSFSVGKSLLGSNGSVVFTSTELVSLPVNQPLTISVSLSNSFTATHNGIKHGFNNGINYQKISYLKP